MINFIEIPKNIKIKIYLKYIKIISATGILVKQKSPEIKLIQKNNKLFLIKTSKKNKYELFFLNLIFKHILALSKGCYKVLVIEGIGYKLINNENNLLTLKLGFSHDVYYKIPKDIYIFSKTPNTIIVYGTNFQQVAQVSAEIRNLKLPEPYKGKGIRYLNETILIKKGKTD